VVQSNVEIIRETKFSGTKPEAAAE
jgi:hypothetical protein